MPIIVTVIVVLLLAGAWGYRHRTRWVFVLCSAVSLGMLSYFSLGIIIPRLTGQGRFYSVPFGQLQVGDTDVMASALFWVGAWAAFAWLFWQKRERSNA